MQTYCRLLRMRIYLYFFYVCVCQYHSPEIQTTVFEAQLLLDDCWCFWLYLGYATLSWRTNVSVWLSVCTIINESIRLFLAWDLSPFFSPVYLFFYQNLSLQCVHQLDHFNRANLPKNNNQNINPSSKWLLQPNWWFIFWKVTVILRCQ